MYWRNKICLYLLIQKCILGHLHITLLMKKCNISKWQKDIFKYATESELLWESQQFHQLTKIRISDAELQVTYLYEHVHIKVSNISLIRTLDNIQFKKYISFLLMISNFNILIYAGHGKWAVFLAKVSS